MFFALRKKKKKNVSFLILDLCRVLLVHVFLRFVFFWWRIRVVSIIPKLSTNFRCCQRFALCRIFPDSFLSVHNSFFWMVSVCISCSIKVLAVSTVATPFASSDCTFVLYCIFWHPSAVIIALMIFGEGQWVVIYERWQSCSRFIFLLCFRWILFVL